MAGLANLAHAAAGWLVLADDVVLANDGVAAAVFVFSFGLFDADVHVFCVGCFAAVKV